MNKFLQIALVAMFGLALPAHAADARPSVARYAKGFIGPEGLEVALLNIGDSFKNEYIIQLSGINHEWDLKIFKVKRIADERGYNYCMVVDGKNFIAFTEQFNGGGESTYEISIPNMRSMNVSYNKEFSRNIVPEHFLTEYEKQKLADTACR
jgi:hypothetical protein